ncbi:MAG TPA: hypothetical protein VFP71_13465 [Candidatus Angelobacter sp.]|nr:hypothetical protein [Candidatus Angelobacter sp.]
MHKRIAMFAIFCLAMGACAVAQSNPQNPPDDSQQTTSASADQSTKATDNTKPATDAAKTAANDTAKAAPANTSAADHTPVNGIKIPSGSKIYVAPMDGFENYVIAGIMKKKVPVAIVADRNKAEYEIRGGSETEKANWAKMWFLGSDHSNDQASIAVLEIKTGNVVFAYSVNKHSSVRGKQSTGEAIGKHLNEAIGKD